MKILVPIRGDQLKKDDIVWHAKGEIGFIKIIEKLKRTGTSTYDFSYSKYKTIDERDFIDQISFENISEIKILVDEPNFNKKYI